MNNIHTMPATVSPALVAPRRRKRTYKMIEFVRPDGWAFYPYSVEEAFHVMQAAIADGAAVTAPGKWGSTSIRDILYGCGTVNRLSSATVSSVDDLSTLFHRLLLASVPPEIEAWRQKSGFNIVGEVSLSLNAYKPFAGVPVPGRGQGSEADFRLALNNFLEGYEGKQLAVSLNHVHFDVREIVGTSISITPAGFRFVLRFGIDGSVWDELLAETRDGEPFSHTFSRAYLSLQALMRADMEPDAMARHLNEVEPFAAQPGEIRQFVNLDGKVVMFPYFFDANLSRPDKKYIVFAGFGLLNEAENPPFVVYDFEANAPVMIASSDQYDFSRLGQVVEMLNRNADESADARGMLEEARLEAA